MNKEEKKLYKILEECQKEYEEVLESLPFGLNWDEFNEMLGPFSKKIGVASRNYRKIQTPKIVGDIPEYGDVMSLDEFISCCESGGFIDYDGYGHYIKDGKETDIYIYPSDIIHGVFRDDFTQIVWYNR